MAESFIHAYTIVLLFRNHSTTFREFFYY